MLFCVRFEAAEEFLHRRAQFGGEPFQGVLSTDAHQDVLQAAAQGAQFRRGGEGLERLGDDVVGQLPGLGIPPAAGLDEGEELVEGERVLVAPAFPAPV